MAEGGEVRDVRAGADAQDLLAGAAKEAAGEGWGLVLLGTPTKTRRSPNILNKNQTCSTKVSTNAD